MVSFSDPRFNWPQVLLLLPLPLPIAKCRMAERATWGRTSRTGREGQARAALSSLSIPFNFRAVSIRPGTGSCYCCSPPPWSSCSQVQVLPTRWPMGSTPAPPSTRPPAPWAGSWAAATRRRRTPTGPPSRAPSTSGPWWPPPPSTPGGWAPSGAQG